MNLEISVSDLFLFPLIFFSWFFVDLVFFLASKLLKTIPQVIFFRRIKTNLLKWERNLNLSYLYHHPGRCYDLLRCNASETGRRIGKVLFGLQRSFDFEIGIEFLRGCPSLVGIGGDDGFKIEDRIRIRNAQFDDLKRQNRRKTAKNQNFFFRFFFFLSGVKPEEEYRNFIVIVLILNIYTERRCMWKVRFCVVD